jgi:hypothetical protein
VRTGDVWADATADGDKDGATAGGDIDAGAADPRDGGVTDAAGVVNEASGGNVRPGAE